MYILEFQEDKMQIVGERYNREIYYKDIDLVETKRKIRITLKDQSRIRFSLPQDTQRGAFGTLSGAVGTISATSQWVKRVNLLKSVLVDKWKNK